METTWQLPTEDGFIIHGLLNQPDSGPSDRAILIVHGMTGMPEEEQHVAAADYFSKIGYDVIRPYLYCLYCSKDHCRNFQDATIAQHAQDINTVTDHFSSSYKALYAAGHSYGGPSLLTADTSKFKALSLWDPSFKITTALTDSFVKDETGKYVIEWDRDVPVGQKMVEENKLMDRAYCIDLAEKCQAPVQVIFAADGDYIQAGESYNNFVKSASDMKVIQGTTHCFREPGTTEPLLSSTRQWFDKFQL